MTTKFSRNRARVQPTPKVCKSPKPIPPVAPTYPTTIAGGGNWNVAYLMFQFSTLNTGATLTQGPGNVYTGTMLDTNGRTWTMTVTLNIGSATTCTFSCPTFAAGGNDFTGTGDVWNGVKPHSQTGLGLTPAPNILGGATWSYGIS